jgi:UDP-GlcNAc:undecaprenyl-phosphate GlcNAc-1-phosphate transferase
VQSAYAFILALSLASALIPLLIRFAGPLGMVDLGGGRKVHSGATPRTGGIAIVLGTLLTGLLWMPSRTDLGAFAAAAALLFVFGVLDDRFNLDFRLKLLGQTLAALIVTVLGGAVILQMPFVPEQTWPVALAVPFTVLALVGVTNALNLSDGLDGLAGGISLLAVGCLGLLAYQAGDKPVVTLAMAVMGATFGFLRFNSHPARLFMGDSGSQFLGFSAGVLAVVVTQRSDPTLSPVLPLLLLGLPILDTLTAMVRRIARGQSPFAADRTHLHHRLMDAGLNQYEAVALIYGTQFLLAILAYVLRHSADWVVLSTYLVLCAAMLGCLGLLEHHKLHLLTRDAGASPLMRFATHLRETRLLTQVPFVVLGVAIPAVLAIGALVVPGVGKDVGVLAAVLLALLLIVLSTKSVPFFAIERLAAFVTAVTVVYFLNRDGWLKDLCAPCGYLLFGWLAMTTAVWMRFSSHRFKINTQDILILLIAVTIPTLPELAFRQFGRIALETLILFYGIEVLMEERERRWDALRISLLLALAALATKGLLF